MTDKQIVLIELEQYTEEIMHRFRNDIRFNGKYYTNGEMVKMAQLEAYNLFQKLELFIK